MMWDAGTEVDQEPGIGSDQGPRQKAPNTDKAENGVVHKVQDCKMYSQASGRILLQSGPTHFCLRSGMLEYDQ
jgi:hypothetical protein